MKSPIAIIVLAVFIVASIPAGALQARVCIKGSAKTAAAPSFPVEPEKYSKTINGYLSPFGPVLLSRLFETGLSFFVEEQEQGAPEKKCEDGKCPITPFKGAYFDPVNDAIMINASSLRIAGSEYVRHEMTHALDALLYKTAQEATGLCTQADVYYNRDPAVLARHNFEPNYPPGEPLVHFKTLPCDYYPNYSAREDSPIFNLYKDMLVEYARMENRSVRWEREFAETDADCERLHAALEASPGDADAAALKLRECVARSDALQAQKPESYWDRDTVVKDKFIGGYAKTTSKEFFCEGVAAHLNFTSQTKDMSPQRLKQVNPSLSAILDRFFKTGCMP